MTELATIVLDFNDAEANPYAGLMLEVPPQGVQAGDLAEVRLWGPREMLDGWALYAGAQSLGPGQLDATVIKAYDPLPGQPATPPGEYGGELVTQYLSFAGEIERELDYPAYRLVRLTAVTELMYLDATGRPAVHTWRGAVGTGAAMRANNIITGLRTLRRADGIPIYGTLKVEYERIRWRLRWFWTVPAGQQGDQWFFLYAPGQVHPLHRFALELPDLATVVPEPRNVTLLALDDTTEAAIPNAAIWLDGLKVGETDADGLLYLDNVLSGEHALRATATGYLDSDQDELNNEKIVVSGASPQGASNQASRIVNGGEF